MKQNVTQKLIQSHLAEGQMEPGEEIALRIDQTLAQDATGTMVMLEFEAMDRHVIANMGAELGATTTVFPSDEAVRRFLRSQQREDAWREIVADQGASYDEHDEIDLSALEPLIALPSSPGNVVPVREVAGQEIYQSYIGSSANPGLRDFAVPALMLAGSLINVVREEAQVATPTPYIEYPVAA